MRHRLIAVDIDGVVADSHTALLNRYNEQYVDTLRPEDITSWHLKDFVKSNCGAEIYKMFADPTLYDEILPIKGAASSCGLLRSRGLRVIFVSSCFVGTAEAKYQWLVRNHFLINQPVMRDFVVLTDKHLFKADVLIDDKPENLSEFIGKRLLFNQPWNRICQVAGVTRVNNWMEVMKVLST